MLTHRRSLARKDRHASSNMHAGQLYLLILPLRPNFHWHVTCLIVPKILSHILFLGQINARSMRAWCMPANLTHLYTLHIKTQVTLGFQFGGQEYVFEIIPLPRCPTQVCACMCCGRKAQIIINLGNKISHLNYLWKGISIVQTSQVDPHSCELMRTRTLGAGQSFPTVFLR